MNIFAVALPLHYLDIKNTIIEPFLTYRVPSPRPSRGYKKDIAHKNPDFIGVFAVLWNSFSKCQIIDVKLLFSLCGCI